jgi:hypothetical protein
MSLRHRDAGGACVVSGTSELQDRLKSAFLWREDPVQDTYRADITGWWRDPEILSDLGPGLARLFSDQTATVVLGVQSRGGLLGALVALPGGDHRAEPVADALAAAIGKLPAQLAKSLTWDLGTEMAQHQRFSEQTGMSVYFCDPKSPWQRGSNENTNGLLRQYLPRRLNFRTLTQTDFDQIAAELNDRPRQTLGFKTPSQALAEVLR